MISETRGSLKTSGTVSNAQRQQTTKTLPQPMLEDEDQYMQVCLLTSTYHTMTCSHTHAHVFTQERERQREGGGILFEDQ